MNPGDQMIYRAIEGIARGWYDEPCTVVECSPLEPGKVYIKFDNPNVWRADGTPLASEEYLHPMIDWFAPIELDDGTPLKLDGPVDLNSHTVAIKMVYCSFTHSAFPGRSRTSYARRLTGLVGSNHKFHVRNRKTMPKLIDTTKPLAFVADSHREVTFITETSEGHILVSSTHAAAKWLIFDKYGTFVRADNGAGSSLVLKNKPERVTKYIAVRGDGVPMAGHHSTLPLLWAYHPTVNDAMKVVSEDGKIVEMTWCRR